MHDEIARCWSQHHPALLAYLRRCFPGVSAQAIEDAASGAVLDLLKNPAPFARCDSEKARLGLLRCVAWRQLRGALRRKHRRMERALPTLPVFASPPGQEHLADFSARFEAAMHEACVRYGGLEPELMRAALTYRLLSGDSDTRVGARFGVRREALNRAKRLIQRRMAGG
ncbi:MAG: hypothetical protein H6741_30480 [Alphaproteobacteria bacterium]|nr:hypothetical protein [Alphaproteobacteria bacterium]